MSKAPKGKKETVELIQPIKTKRIQVFVLGTTPLIMHRFDFKAWQELLLPSLPKNKNERTSSLKHDPLAEYRGALYRNRDDKREALFHLPNGMIHGALASAALDIPGATKASIERLTSVVTANVDFYGVPEIFCAMVRNSDMNRTPDVRTRPIFRRWAFNVMVEYKIDPLNDSQILNLFGAAGIIVGYGDNRPQKGGWNGKFRIVSPNDTEYRDVVKKEGRVAQEKAFEEPREFDEDTTELLSWFYEEIARREKALPSGTTAIDPGSNGSGEPLVQ